MVAARLAALGFAAISAVVASPCPFGQMAEAGQLDETQTANFFAARALGEEHVEDMMLQHEHTKREMDRQADYYKRQLDAGDLLHGGGLLNGILQPFTGPLGGIAVPMPQPVGLAIIPDAAHPYVKPKKSAVRGMCPTLNTMANHGYINRNGITTFAQAANACQTTLGFGYDTCTFLSGLGLLAGGDIATGAYSIGGADSRVPNTLGPALGISKHGFFEVDQSISRQDTYFGNNANFQMSRFQRIVDITKKYGGFFGLETWAEERQLTYQESRDTNPNFNAGVKWLAVTLAERVFIYRALPNGTFPTLADMQNVGPFYLDETFPDNWFRRATAYNLANVGTDVVSLFAASPDTVPGENQGLNNFIPLGLDFGALTPSEATCFLFTSILDMTPGQFSPEIAEAYALVKAFVNGGIKPFFSSYNCPVKSYTKPGKNAGSTTPGQSTTCNQLINGKYQC